jgi:hypothetical protein
MGMDKASGRRGSAWVTPSFQEPLVSLYLVPPRGSCACPCESTGYGLEAVERRAGWPARRVLTVATGVGARSQVGHRMLGIMAALVVVLVAACGGSAAPASASGSSASPRPCPTASRRSSPAGGSAAPCCPCGPSPRPTTVACRPTELHVCRLVHRGVGVVTDKSLCRAAIELGLGEPASSGRVLPGP